MGCQGLTLCFLVVLLLATDDGVRGNPLDHGDDESNGETKEIMMSLFNRPVFTPRSTPTGQTELIGFSACWQTCKQPGMSLTEIHACSRACLLGPA